MKKNTVESNQIWSPFSQLPLVHKPNNWWTTTLDLSKLIQFLQGGEIQNGDTGNHQNLPPARVVGYLNRFQGSLLPYTNTGTVQEVHKISHPRQIISVQGTAIRTVHSPHEVYGDSKEVKLMVTHRGIRIHQYLDDWLVRARSHQVCLQHIQVLVRIVRN